MEDGIEAVAKALFAYDHDYQDAATVERVWRDAAPGYRDGFIRRGAVAVKAMEGWRWKTPL